MAARVEAEFRDHQRPVPGDVMQPFHIAAEGGLVLQIDVEGREISVLRLQVFGARVVRVGEEQAGRELPAGVDEPLDRPPDLERTHPARKIRGHLVTHVDARQCRVGVEIAQRMRQGNHRAAVESGCAEEVRALGPFQPTEDVEAMRRGGVEQAQVRHFIEPDRVEAGGADA